MNDCCAPSERRARLFRLDAEPVDVECTDVTDALVKRQCQEIVAGKSANLLPRANAHDVEGAFVHRLSSRAGCGERRDAQASAAVASASAAVNPGDSTPYKLTSPGTPCSLSR